MSCLWASGARRPLSTAVPLSFPRRRGLLRGEAGGGPSGPDMGLRLGRGASARRPAEGAVLSVGSDGVDGGVCVCVGQSRQALLTCIALLQGEGRDIRSPALEPGAGATAGGGNSARQLDSGGGWRGLCGHCCPLGAAPWPPALA